MMKVINMLKSEIKRIKKDRNINNLYKRIDATHLIISIRFDDGTYHHILPDQPTAQEIAKDLKKICRQNHRWKTKITSTANNIPQQKVVKRRINMVGGINFGNNIRSTGKRYI